MLGLLTSIQAGQVLTDVSNKAVKLGRTQIQSFKSDPPQQVWQNVEALYRHALPGCRSQEEETALSTILTSYVDVFSAGDSDDCLTNLVQHSNPTFSADQPIKPPPK